MSRDAANARNEWRCEKLAGAVDRIERGRCWVRRCRAPGTDRRGVATTLRIIPRPQALLSMWAACGERVGLMTRAAVDSINASAAHSPPPFPTVLTLEPRLPGRVYISLWIGFRISGSRL